MPYTHKKVGSKYVVYKKGKKVGETEGTKTALNKYLAALHIADKKSAKKEAKSLKEGVLDGNMMQADHPGCEDNIGDIFVVLKPKSGMNPEDMVHQTHAFGMGQFNPADVHGVYPSEEEAGMVAEGAMSELQERMEKVEEKKDKILEKISKHINKLQKEVNDHMKRANESPMESDTHYELAHKKMAQIKELRDTHKKVTSSKRQLPSKQEEE